MNYVVNLKDRVNFGSPPPSIKEKGRGRRNVVIMPDIVQCEHVWKTQHDNCWTIHSFWMMKWDLDSGSIQRVTSQSRTYRQWLELHPECFHEGVPPHISFGGAVTSCDGDPEFYKRWVNYARKEFC